MSNKETQQLIEQLQQLQIQQQVITRRLALLSTNNTREGEEVANTTTGSREPIYTGLKLGDRVKIRNPKHNQGKSGVITKIGKTNITVTSNSGEKIVRAPKNLTKL